MLESDAAMSLLSRPRSKRRKELEWAWQLFESVMNARGACYVSMPITSGKRFVEWRSSVPIDDSHASYWTLLQREVVNGNRRYARSIVERLRQELCMVVIDPSAVNDALGWTQDDYRLFWGGVIERYAAIVTFVDGWEFSSGCGYEFLIASRCGIRCVNESMETLTPSDGAEFIRLALDYYHAHGVHPGILEGVVAALNTLISDTNDEPSKAK